MCQLQRDGDGTILQQSPDDKYDVSDKCKL